MEQFQATVQKMLNEDKRRDTFKLLASLAGLKLNREQVKSRVLANLWSKKIFFSAFSS